MKKRAIFALSVALCLAFSGCGLTKTAEAPLPSPTPDAQTQSPAPDVQTPSPAADPDETAGCVGTPLTQEEIDRVNEAFAPEVFDEATNTYYPSDASCFFTSFYDDPRRIDLDEFLRYCPRCTDLTDEDAAEFRAVLAAFGSSHDAQKPSEYPVPTHRYRRSDISDLLTRYAGITVDDLESWDGDGVVYLEEYDAFYNHTSDFGPGMFPCTGGEIDGDTVRLWTNSRDKGPVLTLQRSEDTYLIASYLFLE